MTSYLKKKLTKSQASVAHACNPNYTWEAEIRRIMAGK
jgi:hypothetical protein